MATGKYYPKKGNEQQDRPVWSLQSRHLDTTLFTVEAAKPGPGAYNTRQGAGEGMWDIKFTARPPREETFNKNPGPGRYYIPRLADNVNLCPLPDRSKKKAQFKSKRFGSPTNFREQQKGFFSHNSSGLQQQLQATM